VARPSGLGKGLGALIPPTELAQDPGTQLREVPLSQIEPNPHQPRIYFDEEALLSLADSIREMGVLQPVLLRQASAEHFELVAGERRWRAARRAGLDTIPALIRTVDETTSLEQALVENLHRADLNPLEEAAAYQQLIEDFELTQEVVAKRVGRSRSSIANTIRLLQLPPAVQRMVADRQLSAGHARALLGSPDRSFQEELARLAVAEELTVREVEDLVRRQVNEGDTSDAEPDRGEEDPRPVEAGVTKPAALLELEELLADHLATRVSVAMGSNRGRVVIDFATVEDLERIFQLIVDGRTG
jgi:ParB family chromosome partitioning protein